MLHSNKLTPGACSHLTYDRMKMDDVCIVTYRETGLKICKIGDPRQVIQMSL